MGFPTPAHKIERYTISTGQNDVVILASSGRPIVALFACDLLNTYNWFLEKHMGKVLPVTYIHTNPPGWVQPGCEGTGKGFAAATGWPTEKKTCPSQSNF